MKVSVAALAILITVFCYQTDAAPLGSDPSISCCLIYTFRKIPRNFVVDYYETDSQCPQPGIVFVTRKGHKVCANPKQDWVQQYVNDLKLN